MHVQRNCRYKLLDNYETKNTKNNESISEYLYKLRAALIHGLKFTIKFNRIDSNNFFCDHKPILDNATQKNC